MSVWIIKIVGSMLIIASGYVFSKKLTEKLKFDIRFADGLLSGFVSLEEYVCGMLIPVDEALHLASADAGEASEVFVSASSENCCIRDRFSKALENYNEVYFETISGMLKGISASDDSERRTAFSIIRTRIANIRENAERNYSRLSGLYGSAGIMGGIMIVIVLF